MSVISLKDIYNIIQRESIKIPNVNSFLDDFDKLNREDAKYSSVILSQQTHQRSDAFLTYNFLFGYADRLLEDRSNEIEIQSAGIIILNKIIDILNNKSDIEVEANTFTVFTQRFLADASGVYCNLSISIPLETCSVL